MHTLLLCPDPGRRERLQALLNEAGHRVSAAGQPEELAEEATRGAALVLAGAGARRGAAFLRDRGFCGKVILAGEGAEPPAGAALEEAGADAPLAAEPGEGFARRYAVAAGGRRRVLIAEPDPALGERLRAELQRTGFDATWVPDAEQALSLLQKRSTRPHLLVASVKLPRVSGVQLCRFVKTHDRFRAVRVILSTPEPDPGLENAAAEAEADGMLCHADLGDPAEP